MARHRHQSSVESVLEFSPPFPLAPHQKNKAQILLHNFIRHYGLEQIVQKGYKPAKLIQATHDRVACQDTFLRFFFLFIYVKPSDLKESNVDADFSAALSYVESFIEDPTNVKAAIEDFAEYIMDNFLLPLRASSAKTPQATPRSLSSIQTPTPNGTRQRVSVLRQSCLVRDRHRCVVSRKFDLVEARKRTEQHGGNSEDDEGNLLMNESRGGFQYLEIAHILPHCLTTIAPGEPELVGSRWATSSPFTNRTLERVQKERASHPGYV
ncbi:uncharacterized protein LDX57_005495 [Aspergillus melleus]|uniref:uncharacterized protein n=1 Tax=Aspergillus melleus TaxID=138277 RepID=UPI001E8D3869|nr:uncharacterized protein LDX57_005495 [Aspergillus melleus]KAH8427790.1 hypothetical protein LDX57_005495 [Aspergillus melleus]